MVFLARLNKLMPWIKSWLDLGLELEGVINIEVDPSCLLRTLEWSYSSTVKQVKLTIKYLTHQLTTRKKIYYQREDDKPETVKRRLDVNIAQGEPIHCSLSCKRIGT